MEPGAWEPQKKSGETQKRKKKKKKKKDSGKQGQYEHSEDFWFLKKDNWLLSKQGINKEKISV